MELLLEGRLLPTTAVIGFLEHDLDDELADAFCVVIAPRLNVDLPAVQREPVTGPLEDALERLRPLAPTPVGNKYLLCPTDGSWTAFFDNASTGGDPRPVAAELPDRLGCKSLFVMAVPEPGAQHHTEGRFRTLGFSLAAPGRAGWADAVRVMMISSQGGAAQVQTYGDPLPAEDNDDPQGLTLEQVDRYLRSLGINAFEESAYFPRGSSGLLIQSPDRNGATD